MNKMKKNGVEFSTPFNFFMIVQAFLNAVTPNSSSVFKRGNAGY